jgi:peptidyl-prolyl cis-trans isomerase SurA
MKNKIAGILSALIILFMVSFAFAQDDRVIVTIGEEKVTVDEFMKVYNKNNVQDETIDNKSIEEYLDLYVNFRLKVMEAEELGMDTVTAFQEELAGYRKQLAEPYFANEEIMDELLKEAYDRQKFDLRASHILIMVGPDAMPEDTLIAFNKAKEARERVMNGEAFEKVAAEMSDDESARDRVVNNRGGAQNVPGNGGDLSYFTAFDMVYPFETGAYNTAVGEVSMPVRTDYGYHIIKVTDRINALGNIEVAHLYLKMPENATKDDSVNIQLRIDSLYQRIQDGEDFDELTKEYSDDKGSSARAGLLPKFTVNRMVPEFIKAISTLSDSGDVSKPVLTSYGWHLIKLYNFSGIKPFDEVKADLEKRLKKDKRGQKSTEVIIADIKKEYNFMQYGDKLKAVYELVDSTIYSGEWKVQDGASLSDKLFTLGENTYTQQDFVSYLEANQKIGKTDKINEYVNKVFKAYVDNECRAYEDARLEEKYPEFKAIVKEYRDGILLFELTDQKVWSKAVNDTAGLENYHNEHQNEFMWGQRLDAVIYSLTDTTFVSTTKELIDLGMTDEEIIIQINGDSLDVLKVNHKLFSKGDNEIIDSIKWKKGYKTTVYQDGKTHYVIVKGKLNPEPKSFSEARGLITAGYQEHLEKEWISSLKAKYPVEIDSEVLSSINK